MSDTAKSGLDEIRLQIMWNRLIAVVEDQATVLLRTAFSPIVRECGDLSAGVFDLDARMLAQAVTGTPGHVNSMAASVAHFLDHFPAATMEEGDIFITNDPWMGTGHLNDFTLCTPCFVGGRLVAFFACTSHLTDVGGLGTGPDGTDVHMEGIYIPMLKLASRGKMDETALAFIRANTRQPVETEGDVYSLAACNDVGCERLAAMMAEFEIDTLEPLAEFILSRSEAAVKAEIAKLPRGTWRHSMTADGYEEPIELHAALTVAEDHIAVDFDGTGPQQKRAINVPATYTAAYTSFGLACAIAPEVPNNAGSLGCYRVSAPVETVLNAPYPAAVNSRHIVGQMLPDIVFGCLHQILPDRVPAEGASCLWNLTFRGYTDRAANEAHLFTITAVTNGGTGARPGKDGLSATAYPSGVRGTPVEINESVAPLLFHRKELCPGSGGAGQYRGGLGQVIEVESAIGRDFELLAAYDRVQFPARGRAGGEPGAPGHVALESGTKLRPKGTQTIKAGERLVIHTPGGGGFGPPADRDPSAEARDRAAQLVAEPPRDG
ncbi:MAG: hydantoinase B/oxoprolinase family protein [Pseudomonadota bacterium]